MLYGESHDLYRESCAKFAIESKKVQRLFWEEVVLRWKSLVRSGGGLVLIKKLI